MINDKADRIIKELFESLLSRYQTGFEEAMKSIFIFDYVHFLCYKCHKVTLNRGGSYIDSLN